MLFKDGYPVSDYSWVGVLRVAPIVQGVNSCDGYCKGYLDEPKFSKKVYNSIIEDISEKRVNYGCWFYMAKNAR